MPIASIDRHRLLDKFLTYVRIGTAADPSSLTYPSSPGQWTLGQLLARELQQLGLTDAHQDAHGLVWGTVPATIAQEAPTVLLNAHLDTSPEAPGDGCQPQVISNYDGKPIQLKSGERIDCESTPELATLVGHTLITTDGSTLLGADDKAGVAAIMQCVEHWMQHPEIPHGPIRILFTCDEEIGRGTKHFDLKKAAAQVGYTLDGGGAGTIDVETFSADGVCVVFRGRNTHPSVGKGKMINALRAAARFLELVPSDHLSPETTCDREGFLHPYQIQGGVAETTMHWLLRDFETSMLTKHAGRLRDAAAQVEAMFPGLQIDVQQTVQYRNMADVLRQSPKAVELAEQAYRDLGRSCKRDSIRGGTDGALMSELGLPTPNLSVGQYNIHSVREFASLDEMVQASQHVIRLCELWSQ
jgi:tripeptide aminopeptidase